MRTRTVVATTIALGLFASMSASVDAAPITYASETDFLSALTGTPTTYDFEAASGFPADANGADSGGAVYIGSFGGVDFDATAVQYSSTSSGTQALTARDGCCFGDAFVDFTGLSERPTGFGFYALDLTASGSEFVRVRVTYTSGDQEFYTATLGGSANFTPIFLGIIDEERTIDQLWIFGRRNTSQSAPWLIDDLTRNGSLVDTTAVPEPTTLLLLGTSLAGLAAARRRRR